MRLARLAQTLAVVTGIGILVLVGLFVLALASQAADEHAMYDLMALSARSAALSAGGDTVLVAGHGPQDVATIAAAADVLSADLRASGAPPGLIGEAVAAIDLMVAVAASAWAEAGIRGGEPSGPPGPASPRTFVPYARGVGSLC